MEDKLLKSMEDKLATTERKVIVDLVKMVQRRGMQGAKGDWKEFLASTDKRNGANLSDPTRRNNDMLVSFLKTFTKEEDLMFFAKILQFHSNKDLVENLTSGSIENESPEQRLVRLTLEHPQYPLEYTFPSYSEDWVVINLGKKSKVMNSTRILAVDCEMVLCEDGTEAVVKVCVVNRKLQVKLDKYVNPQKAVADYRTEITGVTAKDLEGVSCSLADIQTSMAKLLTNGAILVGHSLNNDLRVLKVDHARVIDTSLIFRYEGSSIYKRPSLNDLCKSVLGYELRKPDTPHNCVHDASAAMELVLAVVEKGADTNVAMDKNLVELALSKLLVHRIPKDLPSEELHKVIPGEFNLEIKPSKTPNGRNYSALAIFKTPQEAYKAFQNVEGSLDKDSSGIPQKLVTCQLKTGIPDSYYVRKMVGDDNLYKTCSKKREIEDEGEQLHNSKKAKTEENVKSNCNQCEDQQKEIEELKQKLKSKDFQLTTQDKMISNLTKKLEDLRKTKNK